MNKDSYKQRTVIVLFNLKNWSIKTDGLTYSDTTIWYHDLIGQSTGYWQVCSEWQHKSACFFIAPVAFPTTELTCTSTFTIDISMHSST